MFFPSTKYKNQKISTCQILLTILNIYDNQTTQFLLENNTKINVHFYGLTSEGTPGEISIGKTDSKLFFNNNNQAAMV